MGRYGLIDDTSTEDDSSFEISSTLQQPRKRTYPVAFPTEEQRQHDIYPYTAVPVAIEETQEWMLPLGLTSGAVMECFKTALGWVASAVLEYGGKFFTAVGSWMQRHRTSNGDTQPPLPKRQRVEPSSHTRNESSERVPLLSARQPQPKRHTPPRQSRPFTKPQPPPAQDFQDSFLSGAPYIDSRQNYLPSVPRSRRFPPTTRAQRLKSLTSHLQPSSTTTTHPSISVPKTRPTPYDRPRKPSSTKDAESRLQALEQRAKSLHSPPLAQQSAIPKYKWGDQEVLEELSRHHARRPSQKLSTSSVHVPAQVPQPREEQSPKFDFKFTTPIPTKFRFGGQFTSPPRSGAPEYVQARGPVTRVDKAQFTFELPPSAERERHTSRQSFAEAQVKRNHVKREMPGTQQGRTAFSSYHRSAKTDKDVQSSPLPQPQPRPLPNNVKTEKDNDPDSKNTFTILARQDPQPKPLIYKSLPVKSQAYTYHISTPQPSNRTPDNPALSQSFPPTTLPDPPTTHETQLRTPSATPSSPHRRTKSLTSTTATTPTRSSRRAKFTTTYAQDSHREFIRDLRQALGVKRAQRDLEEREIDAQIARLRAEGEVVERTLAGPIPRLPEVLARRVHEALYDTPDDVVVVENTFGKVHGRDIHRLQRGEWLNDEIINYYLQMVRERSFDSSTSSATTATKATRSGGKTGKKALPKIHVFNTFFYQLLSTRGYSSVRRWTKKAKVNLFDMDRVVIPINKGGFHWILAIVNVTETRIEYYDSMGREGESSENRHVLTNIRNFMVEEAKAQNASPDQVATWSFYVPKTPKQKNGWDCGVFTCITAERLTGEVGRMNYGQDHMDRLREYMVAEIIDGAFYH